MQQVPENPPRESASSASSGGPFKEIQDLACLGTLALSTTHGLNDFLTCILGHVAMVRARLGDPARLEHHLSEIEAGAARAAEMLRQLRLREPVSTPPADFRPPSARRSLELV